jgi:hypothetical protein
MPESQYCPQDVADLFAPQKTGGICPKPFLGHAVAGCRQVILHFCKPPFREMLVKSGVLFERSTLRMAAS